MNSDDALNLLQQQFRDLLNDTISLTLETTEEDIEKWDSLFQAQLVTSLENFLDTKFSLREILSWESVGDIVESIINHTT